MGIRLHWCDPQTPSIRVFVIRNPTYTEAVAPGEAPHLLSWAVPPGRPPTSVACLQAKDVSEITRILRTIDTCDPFGTLNMVPLPSTTNAQIRQALDITTSLIHNARDKHLSDWLRADDALQHTAVVYASLRTQEVRK